MNWKEKLIFYADDSIFDEIFDIVIVTVTPINDPPGSAEIIQPKDGYRINESNTLDFKGACADPDLNYSDELTFKWFSNISGKIGEGDVLQNVVLDVGFHLITLEVTDIENRVSITTINISVLTICKPDKNESIDDTSENSDTQSETKHNGNKNIIIMVIVDLILVIIFVILLFIFFRKKKPSKMNKRQNKETPPFITKH